MFPHPMTRQEIENRAKSHAQAIVLKPERNQSTNNSKSANNGKKNGK